MLLLSVLFLNRVDSNLQKILYVFLHNYFYFPQLNFLKDRNAYYILGAMRQVLVRYFFKFPVSFHPYFISCALLRVYLAVVEMQWQSYSSLHIMIGHICYSLCPNIQGVTTFF